MYEKLAIPIAFTILGTLAALAFAAKVAEAVNGWMEEEPVVIDTATNGGVKAGGP